MGVICDLFSCFHLDGGPMENVQNYVTPNDPEVIRLAQSLECDPYQMYGYVQSMKYVEPVNDAWQMPSETIRRNSGDCLDFSATLVSMLIYCGYGAWISLVYLPDSKGGEPEFHAYVEVILDGALIKLESTCPPHKCSFGQMPKVRMVKVLDFSDAGVLKRYA